MFAATINSIFTEKISLMEGDFAPSFELLIKMKSSYPQRFLGKKLVVYFFPYADTPG